ncbi:phytoene desaturase family protein [Bacillus sp. 165]|uniref:phytoene desaturase family protein n=1 Tax=Bacillus sp. 165 TaxID=1529117 RepID=UPI001ADC8EC2|nr:phytoene desaturase family protein [Bacillus sp. 165]MBO9128690.1 phytoene desaturase [Bacillus sp. 165]
MRNTGIVGGGIGSLIAALLLSKQGINVTIFEKQHKLGGRLSFVERDGYRIDEGPTIVLLPKIIEEILEKSGIDRGDYSLLSCDPLYKIHYKDGSAYTKYADQAKQLEELQRVFPGEQEGYLRFMKDMKLRFSLGKPMFLEKSFIQKRDFFTYENIKTLLKLKVYQTTKKMMSSYFQDEKLQDAYSLQTLYIGGNPSETPAIYSLVSYSEHEFGIWYIKGGYAGLVSILEKELRKRKIEIYYGTEVEKIEVQKGRAEGLWANNKFYSFDTILVNGDFPNMQSLVDTERTRNPYVPSSGCVLLYFGLNKTYKEAEVHQFFLSGNMDKHMQEIFITKEVPTDPSFYTFHPSLIDSSLAPAGKGVLYTLVPVPSGDHIDWKNEANFVERIIDSIQERGFPNLRNHIEWMRVKTPNEAMTEGLYQGGSFGIAPILLQSGVFRPQIKPFVIENVYAAGASIHPGGGVPIVMLGANLAVEAMLEDLIQRSGTH